MTVETLMSQEIFTVRMDDSIGTIREILRAAQFHHLLVVDGRKLVGILSDRDVLRVIGPYLGTLSETTRDVALLDRRVHQIMTRKPITVSRNTSIETAVALLIENGISCLPVISSDREIEGIVTWRDLLRAYIQRTK